MDGAAQHEEAQPEAEIWNAEDMADAGAAETDESDNEEAHEASADAGPQEWSTSEDAPAHQDNAQPEGDDRVDLFGGDDAVLDEEMLRDLVSDIVRQELQGALGERITRNVRKLVRREIHRALASQDFD